MCGTPTRPSLQTLDAGTTRDRPAMRRDVCAAADAYFAVTMK